MKELKRVCAYCRVSTDKSDQANSFEAQRRFFEEYIGMREDWVLCGIYCDEGITGTSTRRRTGFNSMIRDAEAGKVELIVTKEISRFARNTLDSIYYTRRLRGLGVGVIFMNDGINTLDADSELRLTIMACVAQEESRRTSERVKWGQRRQMERGVVFGRAPIGYKLNGGSLEIDCQRAPVVRDIFRMYTEDGLGTHAIARSLSERGVAPPDTAEKWSAAAVARILKNEKYCGDLIQQKTYTPDFLSHEKRINRGQLSYVMLRDHHEAIISAETFEAAQRILEARGGKSRRGGMRLPFSGKVRCGVCGCGYVSKFKNNKSGGYRVWRCSGGCGNGSVRDSALREAVEERIRELDRSGAASELMRILLRHGEKASLEDIEPLIHPALCDEILGSTVKQITVERDRLAVILCYSK